LRISCKWTELILTFVRGSALIILSGIKSIKRIFLTRGIAKEAIMDKVCILLDQFILANNN